MGAVGAVIALYAAVSATTESGSWLRDFLFERSLAQPLSLTLFFFALGTLALRLTSFRGDRIALRSAQTNFDRENPLGTQAALPPNSVVAHRLERLRSFRKGAGSKGMREYAQHLATQDQIALENAHSAPSDVINVLPLIGFAGSLVGLSRALYVRFAGAASSDPSSFAGAIATAWDSSLLAIACTILLISVQRTLRRREMSLQTALGQLVDERLDLINVHAEENTPEVRIQPVFTDVLRELREQLEHVAEDMASIAAGRLVEGATAAANTVKEMIENAAENVFARQNDQHEKNSQTMTEAVASNVSKVVAEALGKWEEPLRQQVTELRETGRSIEKLGGSAAVSIADAVRENLSRIVSELSDTLDRPRQIQLVEIPAKEKKQ